jgi:hypothetical protein
VHHTVSMTDCSRTDRNAEYAYIAQTKEIWFVDYILGIAFNTPIGFRGGLFNSGRPYKEFNDIKDFQDYMDEMFGHEVDFESSVDPITKEEQTYSKRIIRYQSKKVACAKN